MVTHKLHFQPEVHDQDVVCVNTVLPAYMFVFELNKALGIALFRCREDIAITDSKQSFALYEYHSSLMQKTWRVVENRFTAAGLGAKDSLFAQTERRFFLFPELQQTDLLVCVNGLTNSALKKIKNIGQVSSCYRLPNKLNKIKEQLTF